MTIASIIAIVLALFAIALVFRLFKWVYGQLKGQQSTAPASAGPQDEVYAAIFAAIHLYNQELHDEEPTGITSQKTERSLTPCNANYISMNHYFQNRHF